MNLGIAVIVCIGIIYIGYILYKNKRNKLEFYKDFLMLCEFLETEVGFFQNNIKQILQKYKCGNEFALLLDDYIKNNNIGEWCKRQNILTDIESSEVEKFFNKLGRMDTDTQIIDIQNFKVLLKQQIQTIKETQLKKSKLMFNLSIMLGLLAFIVII